MTAHLGRSDRLAAHSGARCPNDAGIRVLRYHLGMIKYISSKRILVSRIGDIAGRIPGVETACDIFRARLDDE